MMFFRSRAVAASLTLAAGAAEVGAQFLISEFSASNKKAIQDRYGDAPDWIEIVNASEQAADLAGWRLTDNAANLSKWIFPPTNLPPGVCMVVFASDRNRGVPGEELHTNFELKKDGEYLALVRPDGSIVHEFRPAYPAQVTDVSYGILPGGTTNVLLGTNSAYRYTVPTNSALGGAWLWWEFDDSSWSNGVGIAGFDTNNVYRLLIQTSVSNRMHNRASSLYIRAPLVVDRPAAVRSMELEISIDDGFIAYLNGSEVARTNMTMGVPAWNSTATSDVTTNALGGSIRFPVSRASRRLVQGTNWFCLQAVNRSTSNADFAVRFLLRATTDAAITGTTAYSFFAPPSPGAPNDINRSIRGPLIEWATESAVNVQTGATISVTARVAQTFYPVVTHQVKVFWRAMYDAETEVLLRDDGTDGDPVAGDGIYHGAISTTTLGTNQMIRWRFEARDVSNNVTRLPPFHDFADSPEYFGAVAVDPALHTGLPVFYWFCQSTSMAETEMGTRASVCFLSNFYDNVGVNLHGQSSSGFPLKSHNFDFNRGHRFLYMPGQRKVADIDLLSSWADKSKCRLTIAYGSFGVFGHPTHFAFPVRVHCNGAFHGIFDMAEDADDRYLARNGLNPEGALYKMYNSLTGWWPGTPTSGSGAEKKNRRDEGNADLKELVQSLQSLTGDALARYVFDNVDVCRAMNYFAIMAIMQDHDHGHKNYYLYRDTTGDQRWSILPQDADLTFGHVWSNTNPPNLPPSPAYFDTAIRTNNSFPFNYTGNRLFSFLMTNAVTREMFLCRVRTLLDRTLAPDQTFYQDWIGSLTNQMTADYADFYARWKNTPWGPQTNWETMVEEANRIIGIFIPGRHQYISDRPGLPPSQPPDTAIVFGRLDISPAGGNQDQEFIELINTNAYAVDISDWSLSNAVTFAFGGGTVIPAGGRLFASPNTRAFRQRATSPRSNEMALVTGPYRGRMSSWGETIELWNDRGTMLAATNYPSNPSDWQRHLRITEIMYRPTAPPEKSPYTSDWEFEWVELANFGTNNLDLAGVSFTAGIMFRFTNNVVLPPSGRIVVARNVAAFASRYDTNGVRVVGDFTDLLDNDGETLKLEDPSNDTILEFRYEGAWSAAANGRGASLVHTNAAAPHTTWGDSAHWTASPIWQGTPGRGEPEWPPEAVVVNEWLAHSDGDGDWIEIRNLSDAPIDIGGWWLSDSLSSLRKFVIPPTVLSAGGFAVLHEAHFNNTNHPGCVVPFALSELGEEIHLTAATNGVSMAYRHSVIFEASDPNVSFARHITSDGRTVHPAARVPTPGLPNALPRVGPVVISELLYVPEAGGMEFIELYVPTNALVPMYDPAAPTNVWRLTTGISFDFPLGTVLTGLQHALVVRGDPAAFRASNAIPRHVPVFGPFSGALDNSGERIRLRKPGPPEPDGYVPYVAADEVEYGVVWPWPAAGRVGGRSIEKINSIWYGNDPAHWRAGLPGGTPGAGLSDGDSDGDTIPDEWELDQFGDLGPPDPAPDRDGDARPDLWQFLDGSGASNATPPLVLDWAQRAPPTAGFQTRPAVGPGYQGRRRLYSVEASTSMTASGWTPVAGLERIVADGSYIRVTNAATAPVNAMRIRAWLEPVSE